MTCSSCSYVDEENRRVRDQFECRVCRKNLHADVNAARNLKERFLAGWAVSRGGKEQALRRQVNVSIANLSSARYRSLWSKGAQLTRPKPLFSGGFG
ncbi:zinc ribbon domain-containing protein [Pyrinomonas methylaliphatogenes]|uniref:zinc ribbon domain-containing protein n=1 Tax=Pyrinomonas methylaliphatogenes TaxID=454194 RepID=UPI0009F87DF7